MAKNRTEALSRADASQFLSWENLGAHPPGKAFRESLRELVMYPGRFFERMATSGGLREPLMFYWTLLTLMVVASFPLALAHFLLTAPDPSGLTVSQYNMHLLAPRVAGFVTILLPVLLVVGALAVLVTGTIFYMTARLFGADDWEGCVSVWCYARGAAMAPLAAAEWIAALITIACYLLSLASPGMHETLLSLAQYSMWTLCGLAAVLGTILMLAALATGCGRAFGLGAAGGARAGIAGLIVVLAVVAAPPFCWFYWGRKPGAIALDVAALLLIFVMALGRYMSTKAKAQSDNG